MKLTLLISLLTVVVLTTQSAFAAGFDCYLSALDKVSPPSGAVKLCEGMKSDTSPADCFILGSSTDGVGPSTAFKLCTRSTSVAGPISCFTKLKDESVDGLTVGDSVGATLCRGSNGSDADIQSRLSCWGDARRVGTAGTAPGFSVDPGLAAQLCAQ